MKLDIIFAGEAKDQQQMLLDLLAPLGIDKYTVTEAKSDRKNLEHTLVAAAVIRSFSSAGWAADRPILPPFCSAKGWACGRRSAQKRWSR